MSIIKTLLVIALGVFSVKHSQAQGGMMDPITYKLKNGLTVIVAENQNASKVFLNFSLEPDGASKSNESDVNTLLTAILNEAASKSEKGITFSEKGGNIAVPTENFGNSLATLSSIVQELVIDQSIFDKMKIKVIDSLKSGDYYPETVTIAGLNGVTLDQVKDFYTSEIIPSNAFITIAGNISPSEAKSLIRETLGDWKETTLAASGK